MYTFLESALNLSTHLHFSFLKQKKSVLLLANQKYFSSVQQTPLCPEDPVYHANSLTACDLYIKKILIAQVSICTC